MNQELSRDQFDPEVLTAMQKDFQKFVIDVSKAIELKNIDPSVQDETTERLLVLYMDSITQACYDLLDQKDISDAELMTSLYPEFTHMDIMFAFALEKDGAIEHIDNYKKDLIESIKILYNK